MADPDDIYNLTDYCKDFMECVILPRNGKFGLTYDELWEAVEVRLKTIIDNAEAQGKNGTQLQTYAVRRREAITCFKDKNLTNYTKYKAFCCVVHFWKKFEGGWSSFD